MPAYFKVKDYERYQHYKNRNPPWIKFYTSILEDYELGALPDATKAHLFAIWLLASRYQNRIPLDAAWVAGKINARSPVDLDFLFKTGFLIKIQGDADCKQDASDMLATCYARDRERDRERDRAETETEVETRKKEIDQFIKQAATGLKANRTEMSADERKSRWLSKVYHFIAGVTGNPDRAAAIVDRWHGGDPWAKDLVEKVDKCRKAGDKRGALELIEGKAA